MSELLRCDKHHIAKPRLHIKSRKYLSRDPKLVLMKKISLKSYTGVRLAAIAAVLSAFAYGGLNSASVSKSPALDEPKTSPTPKRHRQVARKYSQFDHNLKAHTLECGTCHKFPSDNWKKVRLEKEAFPDVTEYPKHESCLNCHKQQFFRGATPTICSICHTNRFPPRDSTRFPFPNPREIFDTSTRAKAHVSDFAVGFPHDKHIEIVSIDGRSSENFTNAAFIRPGPPAGEESCSVCHKTFKPQGESDDEYVTKPPAKLGDDFWLKKGTFKTMPIGHTTCFTCHSTDTGILPAPNDCAACHKLKTTALPADFDAKIAASMGVEDKLTLDTWGRRESAGKFRHEWFSHAELSCSTCHDVAKLKTEDPVTRRVTVSACATCHATATSDDGGAMNFEVDARKANAGFQCVKCHVTFGKLEIPKSHLDAIAKAGEKK